MSNAAKKVEMDSDLAEATAGDDFGGSSSSSGALSKSTVNNLMGGDPLDLGARMEKMGLSTGKDTLRTTILSFVAKDKFDLAAKELRYYQQYRGDIKALQERTERLFDHGEELILAIKNKKSFPNIDLLPMAKRQEIYERVQEHFDDLVTVLKRIERIESDIRVQDARSTVWVLQALIVSALVLIIWAVVVETYRNMGLSFSVVSDDISDTLFKLIGL